MTSIHLPRMMVNRVHSRFHLRACEWQSSLAMMGLGILFFAVPTLFQSRPFYTEMIKFAPQSTWAMVTILISSSRITALIVNGSWRFSAHIRAACAVLSSFVWIEIVAGLVSHERISFGFVLTTSFILSDAYSAFRAAADAQVADKFKEKAV